MSAVGGTLAKRGTVHVPVWPIAAALAAAIAAAIVLSLPMTGTNDVPVTRVSDLERFANSSAAVREQGGALPLATTNPGMWTQAQAEAYADSLVTSPVGLENPGAYATVGGSFPIGLENPGAYVDQSIAVATGLENPGAYAAEPLQPKADGFRPIEVNGEICGQCR